MAAAPPMAAAAAAAPCPVYNVIPVTPFGIHRANVAPKVGSSFAIAPDGTVCAWTEPVAANTAAALAANFVGVSCFAPTTVTPNGHGVIHSDHWADPCVLLSNLHADFRLVHDFDRVLRMRKDRKALRVTVPHYSLFTVVSGKTEAAFLAEVDSMFPHPPPCSFRAAAEPRDSEEGGDDEECTLTPSEPWGPSDMDGQRDRAVGSIYRVAKLAYPLARDLDLKLSLNSLMTFIATAKPTTEDFSGLEARVLLDWYRSLKACDCIVERDALSLLGPAQAFFEDLLDVDFEDGDSSSGGSGCASVECDDPMADAAGSVVVDDVPDAPTDPQPASAKSLFVDVTRGVSSELVIEFLTYSFLSKHRGLAIRNMGLLHQKIIFLVDAQYVDSFGKRLLDECPQAWTYGPCYPRARRRFLALADARAAPTCPPVDEDVRRILVAYLDRYHAVDPMSLVEKLHATELWAAVPKGCNHEISSGEIQASLAPGSRLRELLVTGMS